MEIFIVILELIGTVAFSASGAMAAVKKGMDIFGVVMLGIVTAVGGGAIRDITLGITPPTMFIDPIYSVTALVVAVIVFLPSVQRCFSVYQRAYEIIALIMDSVGLGIFTVIGIRTAFLHNSFNFLLFLFVGVVTGVGGGVLRDVLAGDRPYIFVKHIYACASIAGAVAALCLWRVSQPAAIIAGAVVTVVIRLLSAHFRWSLPKAKVL